MESKYKGILDGTTLKIIAMISMVLDHTGDNFFPDQLWMRALGRIAMPVFAFCIAEGFRHTHDQRKYLLRLFAFACISEIPFDLVVSGKILEFSHQNIMFTFSWAVAGLMCYEHLSAGKHRISSILVLLAFAAGSLFLSLDYHLLAVGLIDIYWLLRDKAPYINNAAAVLYHILMRNKGIYWFGLLGFLPVLLYNGKRGRGMKWLFYTFYPGHLLLIWFLRDIVSR